MQIQDILPFVQSTIKSREERAYFLIHEGRYKKILKEIQNLLKNEINKEKPVFLHKNDSQKIRVLDVGCFPYHLGRALELLGHEVWGISSAHEPIRNKKVSILNIETDTFPYKDNFFDLVLCSEVLEHLPHSPVPAIKEMFRVTRPGGHVLITTPNINRSINQGKMLLGKSPMYDVSAFLENEGKGSNLYHRHNREFTLGELKKLVSHAGWTIAKATHVISYSPFRRRNRTDHPLLWTGKFANFLAMAAIPRLRDTLLIIASK